MAIAEINNKVVYCDSGFLEKFSSRIPTDEEPQDDRTLANWLDIRSFLQSETITLIVDMTCAELQAKKQENEFIGRLWKLTANGQCHLETSENGFPKIDVENKNLSMDAVYLTLADDEVCKQLEDMYGILVLNPSMFLSSDSLFRDNGAAIEGDNQGDKNWDSILSALPNDVNQCNSMIVVDNYSLKDRVTVDRYLLKLLDFLVPKELKGGVSFDLSLFYNTEKSVPQSSYYEQYKIINDWLKEQRPNLKVNFAAYKSGAFHDRTIITNNLWIGVGKGVDLSSSKSTTVSVVFPYFTSRAGTKWPKAYSNLIKDARKCACNTNLEKDNDYWCDTTRQHRLLKITIGEKEQSSKNVRIGPKVLGKIDLSALNTGRRR